jgi:hypothetical protein
MKRYTIKKIKDRVVEEITLFDRNKIFNEVDKILSSHKMYDNNVNEISYVKMTWKLESIREGTWNTGKTICFYTPLIEINCTSAGAKGAVTRLMRREGFETELYGSFGVAVCKWDEDKIFQLTRLKEKK